MFEKRIILTGNKKNGPVERRQLITEMLSERGLDAAIISNPKHIFYLTGFPSNLNMWITLMKGPRTVSFLCVSSDGKSDLLLGTSEYTDPWPNYLKVRAKEVFREGITQFDDYKLDERMVADPMYTARELKKWLLNLSAAGIKFNQIGVEDWHLAGIYMDVISNTFANSKFEGVSSYIDLMRHTKGADEIECLRKATSMVELAFETAKQAVSAGKSEMDVFREMNNRSFERFGQFGEIFGDHVSGNRSLGMAGVPTNRKLSAGETLILDLQATDNNYWSDLARTYVVGKPSTKQEEVMQTLIRAKEKAENLLVPGTRGKEVYKAVSEELIRSGYSPLPHHAGHGIGLDDQEAPWFIPKSESEIKSGQVCVVEPGIYDRYAGGARIEDAYIITDSGYQKISSFPVVF